VRDAQKMSTKHLAISQKAMAARETIFFNFVGVKQCQDPQAFSLIKSSDRNKS